MASTGSPATNEPGTPAWTQPPGSAGPGVEAVTERNGRELVGMREILHIEEPTPCIHAMLPSLVSGHYRIVYEIEPNAMPPLSGAFDVTPE